MRSVRHTGRSASLLVVLAALGLLLSACAGQPEPPPEPASPGAAYVRDAEAIAAWLRSVETSTPDGPAWPDDAREPGTVTAWFADGVAGKVWFFLALRDATGDESYLADARRGADYLVAALAAAVPADVTPPVTSLYYGLPGLAIALDAMARATGDARYATATRSCLDTIEVRARRRAGGVEWSATYDDLLYGNAGTALFLAEVAQRGGDPQAGAPALAAGRALLARGITDGGGLNWRFRRDAEFVLPNFSHGTAGVGYLMATLYQTTGDQTFLKAALSAAAYLESIARTDGGVFLVPYGWPDPEWEGQYEAGWAHGAAGTARFFYRLWQVTGEDRWRQRVLAAGRGIEALAAETAADAGRPAEPLDVRFGSAGVAMFQIDLARVAADPRLLDAARERLDTIIAGGIREATGLRWVTPRPAFVERAGEPAAYTGYFTGAAGYGMLLLRYAAAVDGRPWSWRLPDDPF